MGDAVVESSGMPLIEVEVASRTTFAAAQNAVPVIRRIVLRGMDAMRTDTENVSAFVLGKDGVLAGANSLARINRDDAPAGKRRSANAEDCPDPCPYGATE